jgi:tRNA pseudouridine32 synthase/23S rRNA pseudouridine746 synthase
VRLKKARTVRESASRVKPCGITKAADMLGAMELLHEDDALLVVVKPAGLLSVPGRGEAGRINLTAQVQARWPDALAVHRLDQATSGLMIFARGAEAHRRLSMGFEARAIGKQYRAVVEGDVAEAGGEIAAPLIVDWPNRPRQIVSLEHGKPALTHWRRLDRAVTRSLLLLEPVTGRSHQLRVHLQSIGHPIVGDDLYGTPAGPCDRLLLHASRLVFAHPLQRHTLVFDSEPPFGLGYSDREGSQEGIT